ncbi:MAG: hypothetical protein J2P48_06775 [Alphaproteobacteria bacterium]|nr:hypothetical protein [Alphaproteobacteria bacterium]
MVLIGGGLTALVIYFTVSGLRRPVEERVGAADPSLRNTWRMPSLTQLPARRLTALNRVWLVVLRAYLFVAAGLVLVRILTLATSGA